MAQRRRRRVLLEVRLVGEDLVPVRDVAERRERVAAQLVQLDRPGRRARVHRDRGDDEDHGREEAPGAPRPERPQVDALRGPPFAEQQARDQEAAEDEERVDAEVAAARPRDVAVVEQDRDDGEGAQPVERRHVRQAAARVVGPRVTRRRAHAPAIPLVPLNATPHSRHIGAGADAQRGDNNPVRRRPGAASYALLPAVAGGGAPPREPHA